MPLCRVDLPGRRPRFRSCGRRAGEAPGSRGGNKARPQACRAMRLMPSTWRWHRTSSSMLYVTAAMAGRSRTADVVPRDLRAERITGSRRDSTNPAHSSEAMTRTEPGEDHGGARHQGPRGRAQLARDGHYPGGQNTFLPSDTEKPRRIDPVENGAERHIPARHVGWHALPMVRPVPQAVRAESDSDPDRPTHRSRKRGSGEG